MIFGIIICESSINFTDFMNYSIHSFIITDIFNKMEEKWDSGAILWEEKHNAKKKIMLPLCPYLIHDICCI